jgi:hypothetical protein
MNSLIALMIPGPAEWVVIAVISVIWFIFLNGARWTIAAISSSFLSKRLTPIASSKVSLGSGTRNALGSCLVSFAVQSASAQSQHSTLRSHTPKMVKCL